MRSTTNAGAEHEAAARPYPWYDSVWLAQYARAKAIVGESRPRMLAAFVDALRILHTSADFKPRLLERPFDAATLEEIRRVAASLRPMELELHEARTFRRFLVHDHPFFTQLQHRVVSMMEEAVGEPVEASYNFLSLYSSTGICPVHMDAPDAKWTLDLCVDQSRDWPIYLSDVRPWPEPGEETWSGSDWERRIKASERFTRYDLRPGQAIVFSGSSQFHYRNAMPPAPGNAGSTMLFLHFIPRGAAEIVRPENWARLFDMPELAAA